MLDRRSSLGEEQEEDSMLRLLTSSTLNFELVLGLPGGRNLRIRVLSEKI